jgi:hypothetical protein
MGEGSHHAQEFQNPENTVPDAFLENTVLDGVLLQDTKSTRRIVGCGEY